jgi:hypothetical protein
MDGCDETDEARGAGPAPVVDLSLLLLRLVAGVTFVGLALTESFAALPAALGAYASAHFLLRGD